jgi:hypothetical protein
MTRKQRIGFRVAATLLALASFAVAYIILRHAWGLSEPVAAGAAAVFALASPADLLYLRDPA